jgi:UDP-N-acetyl-L-fucosamine synthase
MAENKKLKVMTILGTRPEIIRLSRILPKMDEYFDHKIVFTSQSYSFELSDIFFQEMQVRKPDYILNVKAETLGKQIANIIEQTEKAISQEKPDALLILGDTNSALSAINAKRMKIPIFHMEAGNRCFDWNVPEEINRRIIDHISNYNLCYTEHARRYLIREGIDSQNIFVTGSPLTEVFKFYRNKIDSSKILETMHLKTNGYFLVSVHREENVDNKENLLALFDSFEYLAKEYKIPIVVSLHPRTKKRIDEYKIKVSSLITFSKPFGYFDYCKLQKNALCVLSDSGTIQEESAILDFNAIQIRVSTERPEAFDSGSIILCGFNKLAITQAVKLTVDEREKGEELNIPNDYKDINVSSKVVKLILGLTSVKTNE